MQQGREILPAVGWRCGASRGIRRSGVRERTKRRSLAGKRQRRVPHARQIHHQPNPSLFRWTAIQHTAALSMERVCLDEREPSAASPSHPPLPPASQRLDPSIQPWSSWTEFRGKWRQTGESERVDREHFLLPPISHPSLFCQNSLSFPFATCQRS